MGDFASTVVDSWLGSTPVDITCFLPLCVRSGIWKSEKSISTFTSAVATNWKAANSDLGYLPLWMLDNWKSKSNCQPNKNGTTDNRCKMKPTHYSPKSSLFTIPINGQLEMKQYYLTEIVFSMLSRSTWIGFSVRLYDVFCCAFSPVSADFFFFLFFFFFFWFSPSSTVSTMASAERCNTPRPSLEDCSLSCEGLTRTGC